VRIKEIMNANVKQSSFFSAAAFLALSACSSTPAPKELVEARAAYSRAQSGTANQVNPAQVHVAKESLDQAEHAFAEDPDAPETRDRAYIALRKAQLAEAQAGMMTAEANRDQAQKDLQATQIAMGKKTQAELNAARSQLSTAAQRQQMTEEQLKQERAAREEAEKRAKEALENLAKMAQVKQETRGMVITLSGAVLFTSGQSALLPAAMSALDNVVVALKANPDRNIVVEGHTDSQGQRAYNMDLSQKRADSVRSYIVSRGIPSEIIRAQGFGPDRPVADNNTAEGRANNRRVEIIVSPAERK
jgi:outer membrane protein OmpA-like peptidoglycan-associated protein